MLEQAALDGGPPEFTCKSFPALSGADKNSNKFIAAPQHFNVKGRRTLT